MVIIKFEMMNVMGTPYCGSNQNVRRRKDNNSLQKEICPYFGNIFTDGSALSRKDNKTLFCPDCGTRKALYELGIGSEEQEKILEMIHRSVK